MNDAEQEPAVSSEIVPPGSKVINIGLSIFEEALREQGLNVVVVQWSPPRKLQNDIDEILRKIL